MGFAGVGEAAVIGVPDNKWAERPLMLVVKKPNADGAAVTKYALARVACPSYP
jgi:acyl-CoA synthetase (AMP-forming)/AMP-acid ligase II